MLLFSLLLLISCNTFERKIVGSWYALRMSEENLISNDSLIRLIKKYEPELLQQNSTYPYTSYSSNNNYFYHNSDYNGYGTYKIIGDTLFITSSNNQYISIIIRIKGNIMVTKSINSEKYLYEGKNLEKIKNTGFMRRDTPMKN